MKVAVGTACHKGWPDAGLERAEPEHSKGMIPHYSYNSFHLGDQMMALLFLRRMAYANPQHEWFHFMPGSYLPQMRDVVEDIPTIHLLDIESPQGKKAQDGQFVDADGKHRARNVWKNAGGCWENHTLRNDYTNFYIEWFRKLAAEMGLLSPTMHPANLLFDYPKLLEPAWPSEEYDYLVINSRPYSGQFLAYNRVGYFDPLLEKLARDGKRVVCTQSPSWLGTGSAWSREGWPLKIARTDDALKAGGRLSITQIGNLSLRCKNIIAVATGPLWPCLNVWTNPEKLIIALDCPERNIAPGAIYCRSLAEIEREVGL